MSIIRNHATTECAANSQGEWLRCAKEALQNNKTNFFFLAGALQTGFLKDRQKNTNIQIACPTNGGKSFLKNPIELTFKAFVNPDTGRYAYVGLDECEVAYLNDFRWSAKIISRNDFLLLLEG